MSQPTRIYNRQTGFGLVEIMIALVLGLFVTAGVVHVFLSNKQSFNVQSAQAQLQENARLASALLADTIAKAGYRLDPGVASSEIESLGPALDGTNDGGADLLAGSDTVTVRFQGDGLMIDCHGLTVVKEDISINRFRLSANSELQCDNGDGPLTLFDNVADLQILYGEDTNGDGSVDQYRNAATVDDFDNVLAVHLALLLASDGNVTTKADAREFVLLDRPPVRHPASGTDRAQRRVVERVVSLRNRMP